MRFLTILAVAVALAGCRSYTESTPRQVFESDHPANYRRVFREDVPHDVTIIKSAVVGYSSRPGVVTTDDFEFELIVPAAWLAHCKKTFYLRESRSPDVEQRKDRPIRAWFAPKPFGDYEAFRDVTSVGYVHLLIDKKTEPDGRFRVFISKH